MINQLIGFVLSQGQRFTPWYGSLTGLLLTVGLTANASTGGTAIPDQYQKQAVDRTVVEIAQKRDSSSLPDGIYLYGQSSKPEQIGKEYIVFEARQGNLIGALYLPSSEFSCFHGTLDSNQMNLTVVNPYDQTALSHTIAREQPEPIAAAGGQIDLENISQSVTYPHSIELEGYQPINQLSNNDQRILRICRNNYHQQARN